MKIWIDADAAPQPVKDIVTRAAERLEIDAVMVANQRLFVAPGHRFVTSLRVAGGPDAADDHIAEHAESGDVCITADIPLAARLVPKGVTVIDPRGELLDAENIGERLSVRDFMDGLRGAGVMTGGPSAYGAREKQAFAGALDRALARASKGTRERGNQGTSGGGGINGS